MRSRYLIYKNQDSGLKKETLQPHDLIKKKAFKKTYLNLTDQYQKYSHKHFAVKQAKVLLKEIVNNF